MLIPRANFPTAEIAPHRGADEGEVMQLGELLQPRRFGGAAFVGIRTVAPDDDAF